MNPVHQAASPLQSITPQHTTRSRASSAGNFAQQLAATRPTFTLPKAQRTQPTAQPTPAPTPTPTPQLVGDIDGNGQVDRNDAMALLNYLFQGGPAPKGIDQADANGDGSVNISDVVRLLHKTQQPHTQPLK